MDIEDLFEYHGLHLERDVYKSRGNNWWKLKLEILLRWMMII